MKYFYFLFFSLFSMVSWADFSGKYQGHGREYDSDGLNIECSEASISIEQKADRVELSALIFQCGENLGLWEPLDFAIQNGELFYEGKKVGEISRDMINVKIWDVKTGETEIVYISKDSQGRLNFNRMWNDPSNRSWLNFEGVFEKSSGR